MGTDSEPLGVTINGSIALYSVGAILNLNTLPAGLSLPVTQVEQLADNAIQQLAYGASSGLGTILNAYANPLSLTPEVDQLIENAIAQFSQPRR